jgi:hypothetical protein
MLDAERVVFLVMVGLSFVGLCFGATVSRASGFDGAGFAPRPRVRAGVSSCCELRRCEARVGAFLGAGIGNIQWFRPNDRS